MTENRETDTRGDRRNDPDAGSSVPEAPVHTARRGAPALVAAATRLVATAGAGGTSPLAPSGASSRMSICALVESLGGCCLVAAPDGRVLDRSGTAPVAVGRDIGALAPDAAAECWRSTWDRVVADPDSCERVRLPGGGTGSAHALDVTVANMTADPGVGAIVVVVFDHTGPAGTASELRNVALHDWLTGLPNRAYLIDRASSRARTCDADCAADLYFVDLDDFKTVNDALGHDIGDRLLTAVANRMVTSLPDVDIVCRLGGDEFVVMNSAMRCAAPITDRILAVFGTPFEVGTRDITITASIGVASGSHGRVEDLLRDADIAMYAAKAAGKNRAAAFDPGMRAAVRDRLELASELRAAIHAGDLTVHYQPVYDLRTRSVVGAEALVRWQHPHRGLLPPASFIPLAEHEGLAGAIGRIVLLEACTEATHLAASGTPVTMAVNVSGRQLDSDEVVRDVEAVLSLTGLDPHLLLLEITETALFEHRQAAERLEELKALGVTIAIDDFGTGYGSLNYLRDLPVDVIKIDQSFVASMEDNEAARAIVRTLAELGRSMHLELVAEGVETRAQLDEITNVGCRLAQGFLFSPPVDADSFDATLGETLAV